LKSRLPSENRRILYLVGQLGAGGLERQLYLLLKGMDRNRYRPAVFVWNFRRNDVYVRHLENLNVPLSTFPQGIGRAGKLKFFRDLVDQQKPELVHSYTFHTNFAAAWAGFGRSITAVGSVRSDFRSEKKRSGRLLGRLSARWPKMQIYNNYAGARNARCCRSLFVPKNIFVVRNGLQLEDFEVDGIPLEGAAHILGIGSLLHLKRWDRLVSAAATLKKLQLDFTLEIAGDGPMRQVLERQIGDLAIGDRVRLLGHVDNISALMANSTFLVHTSDYEGCPNVVMEAMAAGRAVVATGVGDIPSIVEDGRTGFLVHCANSVELVDRLATLIRNRALCLELGNAGRAKAQREFSLERLVRETFNAYRAAGWHDPDENLPDCAKENDYTRPASEI
jgi:glycosyltransferase involved in cell wall biosynthesis